MIILDQLVYNSLHSWTREITKQASHFRDEEIEDYSIVILEVKQLVGETVTQGGQVVMWKDPVISLPI